MSTVKIKICGLSRMCDGEYVNTAMPDYAGFVFCGKSRRNVTPELARKLRRAINPSIKTAGVFVNASEELIAGLCRDNTVSAVQLHGGEGEKYIKNLRKIIPGVPIWEAYKIRSPEDVEAAAASTADMVLLDNGGGTGETFDWRLIVNFRRPFILSGGLTPENIPAAVSLLHPDMVDISSGVESGRFKDKSKIAAAVAAVRSCAGWL